MLPRKILQCFSVFLKSVTPAFPSVFWQIIRNIIAIPVYGRQCAVASTPIDEGNKLLIKEA
jgi:hypothetical protein